MTGTPWLTRLQTIREPVGVGVDMPVLTDLTFSHQGLATTTLVLAFLTALTGFVLLGIRYGLPPRERGQTVVRWAHIVLGVCMTVYLIATYYIVPI
ncbi:MAG: hypothetical protein ACI9YT_002994 [Halobacteriales archaeon]|jgi:hypothetical protein